MNEVLKYLNNDISELEVNRVTVSAKISSLDLEINETCKVIDDMQSNDIDVESIFGGSVGHYDRVAFSKEEIEILNAKMASLLQTKESLEKQLSEIDTKLSETKKVVEYYKESTDTYLSTLSDIIGELEFCKKIALSDGKRSSIEIEKVIKKIKSITR